MQGGMHPSLKLEWGYEELLSATCGLAIRK